MKIVLPLSCLLALAACSGKPPEPQAKPAPQVSTPFDALKADEQHAKDVQKIVDRQAEQQRKQVDASSQ